MKTPRSPNVTHDLALPNSVITASAPAIAAGSAFMTPVFLSLQCCADLVRVQRNAALVWPE